MRAGPAADRRRCRVEVCRSSVDPSESGEIRKEPPHGFRHPSILYRQHLAIVQNRADAALQRGGFDHLVIPSGTVHYQAFDDRDYPYAVNPQFKQWVPLLDAPGSWIVYTPGAKPVLVFLQPNDYWHVVPEAPHGYWVEHFDIRIIREADEARAHLPDDPDRCAILGQPRDAVGDFVPDPPPTLVDAWTTTAPGRRRTRRSACARPARSARAATAPPHAAFRAGESEFGIHMAFQHAAGLTEAELPYGSIIGLNEHGAVLHYMHFDRIAARAKAARC